MHEPLAPDCCNVGCMSREERELQTVKSELACLVFWLPEVLFPGKQQYL